jgi:hypothetical protein
MLFGGVLLIAIVGSAITLAPQRRKMVAREF